MSVLLPLYVYPWPGAWDPLYWAANTNPHLNFSVILNPCSGPCLNSKPEDTYLAEMPKLKDWPNIRTLGYVATNYTNKALDTVLAEIQTYANWTSIMNNPKMAVDGIFFDETPGAYDWRSHDFLKAAADEVRRQPGLGQQVVVHNPGAIPYVPWNYLDIANITVIFENTWTQWIDSAHYNDIKSLPANSNLTKDNFALMLHSVPSIPDDLLVWTAKAMKNMTGWNFISSVGVAGEYWHSFSNVFGTWVSSYAAA